VGKSGHGCSFAGFIETTGGVEFPYKFVNLLCNLANHNHSSKWILPPVSSSIPGRDRELFKRDERTVRGGRKKLTSPSAHAHEEGGGLCLKAEIDAWWRNGRSAGGSRTAAMPLDGDSRGGHGRLGTGPRSVPDFRGSARSPAQTRFRRSKFYCGAAIENLSDNREQDYFADGMTESLIPNSVRSAPLKVILHQSVLQYKKAPNRCRRLRRKLKVDALLEGTVLGLEIEFASVDHRGCSVTPAERHILAGTVPATIPLPGRGCRGCVNFKLTPKVASLA